MTDAELSAALAALEEESLRREKRRARFEKADLSRRNKRDLRCPRCGAALRKDGKRSDGVQAYECPECGKRCSDASGTSLASSKITTGMIMKIVTMVMLDCPVWVISRIVGVDQKTAQFWRDRCLDAASEWSAESKLSGHVWIDEMRFAPTRASGFVDGVWTTYAGKLAKDLYMEVALDSKGNGFCEVYRKSGMPTKAMVARSLADRVAAGSKLTHDAAPCHNKAVADLSLVDDRVKFAAGDKEYEGKMKIMSNCCSYLRHCFESHRGIKSAKLGSYANFFMYRWSHVRKHGLKASIEYLFNRVCRTEKSHVYRESFRKSSAWS